MTLKILRLVLYRATICLSIISIFIFSLFSLFFIFLREEVYAEFQILFCSKREVGYLCKKINSLI